MAQCTKYTEPWGIIGENTPVFICFYLLLSALQCVLPIVVRVFHPIEPMQLPFWMCDPAVYLRWPVSGAQTMPPLIVFVDQIRIPMPTAVPFSCRCPAHVCCLDLYMRHVWIVATIGCIPTPDWQSIVSRVVPCIVPYIPQNVLNCICK